MKLQCFFDVTVKYVKEDAEETLFKAFPNAKGIFGGFTNLIEVKSLKWLLDAPQVKSGVEAFADLGLYDPDAETIDDEGLFAFLDGYAKSDAPFSLGMIKFTPANIRQWIKRLKEAAGDDD
jgi:hypothetical protein